MEFSVSKTGENHKEKSLVKKPDEVLTILLFNVRILQKTKISKKSVTIHKHSKLMSKNVDL